MEKQKPWQFYLILAVILLTLYNILPTLFWYSKPLNAPITESRAQEVAVQISERVNQLEEEAQEWISSFSNLLGVSPLSIAAREDDARLIEITFPTEQQASLFKKYLPRAGALIPFLPAQLELYPDSQLPPTKVVVARNISVHLDQSKMPDLFRYVPKYNPEGTYSTEYRNLIYNRATEIGKTLAGSSESGRQIQATTRNSNDQQQDEIVIALAKEMVEIDIALGKNQPKIAQRLLASLTRVDDASPDLLTTKFQSRLDATKTRLTAQKEKLANDPDPSQVQTAKSLESQIQSLDRAKAILSQNNEAFKTPVKPLTEQDLNATIAQSEKGQQTQSISLQGRHPFVESLVIDWTNDTLRLKLYPDVQKVLTSKPRTENESYEKDKLNTLIINEMAKVSRQTEESILPLENDFAVTLNQLGNTQSFLVMDLSELADKQSQQITAQLRKTWQPKTPDLKAENFPIRTYAEYQKEKPEEQKLGLVVYSPVMDQQSTPEGFHPGSLYVLAKGLNPILQKYRDIQNQSANEILTDDLTQLKNFLQVDGFIGYSGASYGMDPTFAQDFIFEHEDFYNTLIKATRENFDVKGDKRYAVLPFTDVEQRILTTNRIDDGIQEDLLKWKEEHSQAQVDLNASNRYLVPAPTKNPYWTNLKLTIKKYFRGDDRKILKWGIDLSGGKTVRIGLRDHNNRPVTNPDDIRQTVNELYTRINKMGVSERTIRIENENIVLEFPGSQNLSASDLVKASAMYFHIVNEKFTPNNPTLRDAVTSFLQDVWNEAVVTNHKDMEGVNQIAWEHLGGSSSANSDQRPRSEAARFLYDNGLRLPNPKERTINNAYDDTLSMVGIMRGEDFAEWEGQSHPLLILFNNYSLEGANLTDIQVGYDPSQGNVLSFNVKRSYEGSQARSGSPRDDFYAWTSQLAEDRIAGTVKENYSHGQGWRMAVVLNGNIITKPTLRAALSDAATISGRFTQREINKLAADLKAGSLSFTPIILSEQNVSPELGVEERSKGITASLVALALVVIAMVGYYRFAGVVASIAVMFNILIMWGVLQNLDAALTLPGIAGIVLTIGMAVDANVLVFERVREEFKLTGRIASSIQAGYRKAFSAIMDSNITTIIAALILLQFDSGPIKGFAVTLIIGIISSMFTALFMTRYFFAGWVQNPNNKYLTMSEWIKNTNFDFLGKAKAAIIISLIVMAAGMGLLYSERNTIFGMDFTGGYSLQIDVDKQPEETNYRVQAQEALAAAGATTNEVEIRQLTHSNQLLIQLGRSMEEPGHPFHNLPLEITEGKFINIYQNNPRITWVVDALEKGGLKISAAEKNSLETNWTVMSGQLSDAMRNNALYALIAALVCILIYIAVRFELKYAIGAVIGLIHDVIITLGILALFHMLGFPVQIDLEVIGAIMTIIGYSLNDTIIVFDRVREEVKQMRKVPFKEVVNHALNVTLSRTLMTSGTTLLVLLALVILGGHSIFSFSLVMTIGVVIGTLSSLFIATPVLVYFHNKEVEAHQKELLTRKA